MRRGRFIVPAILALLAVAATSFGAAKEFSAYPTCKPGANRPDPYCIAGARTTASFIAHQRDRVAYTLCVRKPGGKRNCHDRRTGRAGSVSKVQFSAGRVGTYDLSWKTGGRKVDHDELLVQERRVFVNGDSLAEGTKPYMGPALRGWDVDQSVAVSRHAPQGVAILRRMGNAPPVVVMSLGTNDDPRATAAFQGAVRQTMKIVGRSGCVVWPNIVRPPVGGASYAGYNSILAKESQERRNLRVVEWTRIVAKHPGWLANDGVHVNATGYQARAEAIAKQVRRC